MEVGVARPSETREDGGFLGRHERVGIGEGSIERRHVEAGDTIIGPHRLGIDALGADEAARRIGQPETRGRGFASGA